MRLFWKLGLTTLVVGLVVTLLNISGANAQPLPAGGTTYNVVNPISWKFDLSNSVLPIPGSSLEPGDQLKWAIELKNSSTRNSYLVDMGFNFSNYGPWASPKLQDGTTTGPIRPVRLPPSTSKLVFVILEIDEQLLGPLGPFSFDPRQANPYLIAYESTLKIQKTSSAPGRSEYTLTSNAELISITKLLVYAGNKPLKAGVVIGEDRNRIPGSWDGNGLFTPKDPIRIHPQAPTQLFIYGFGPDYERNIYLVPTEHSNAVGHETGDAFTVPMAIN